MKIKTLREKQILELCISLLTDYIKYLTIEEIKNIKILLENTKNKLIDYNESSKILLPIVNKIWDIELASGDYKIISWNKYSYEHPKGIVTFATLSEKDNLIHFCNMDSGTEYDVSSKSILGALEGDGATIIESLDRKNQYTVAEINGKVINSYNGATKLITPKKLVKKIINPYNYNELILDSRYIKKIRDIC